MVVDGFSSGAGEVVSWASASVTKLIPVMPIRDVINFIWFRLMIFVDAQTVSDGREAEANLHSIGLHLRSVLGPPARGQVLSRSAIQVRRTALGNRWTKSFVQIKRLNDESARCPLIDFLAIS
jgi:hypothetical protein